jgi:hypothetical protein
LQVGPDVVAMQIRQANLKVTGEASPWRLGQEACGCAHFASSSARARHEQCLDRIDASGNGLPARRHVPW